MILNVLISLDQPHHFSKTRNPRVTESNLINNESVDNQLTEIRYIRRPGGKRILFYPYYYKTNVPMIFLFVLIFSITLVVESESIMELGTHHVLSHVMVYLYLWSV